MICPKCGKETPEIKPLFYNGTFCLGCGYRFSNGEIKYAGFLPRFAASAVDGFFLGMMCVTLLFLLAFFMRLVESEGLASEEVIAFAATIFVIFLITFLYEPFATGLYGSTVGKAFLGMNVVDANLKRPIGFRRALVRHLVKFVSVILPSVAFLLLLGTNLELAAGILLILPASCMALILDKKKQSMHDKIAGTYVIFD